MNIFNEISAKFNTDEPILIEDIEKCIRSALVLGLIKQSKL